MDVGLLFRKRTESSQKFIRILLERKYLGAGESPFDIVFSYIISVVIMKILSTPFEVSQTVYQVLGRSENSLFKTIIFASLSNPLRRKVLWSGWLVDLLSVFPNIVVENIAFDMLSILSRFFRKKLYRRTTFFQRFPLFQLEDSEENKSNSGNVPHTNPNIADGLGRSRGDRKKNRLVSGLVSKLIAHIVTYPLEVLRTRYIISQFVPSSFLEEQSLTLRGCLNGIWVHPKHFNFGSGLLPMVSKVIVYICFKEIILSLMKARQKKMESYWNRPYKLNAESTREGFSKCLMVDFVSGAIAECLTFPFSVIIRNLQVNPAIDFFGCLEKIWRREKLFGLFSGFRYQLVGTVLTWFGTMVFFSLSRTLISASKQLLWEDHLEDGDEPELDNE